MLPVTFDLDLVFKQRRWGRARTELILPHLLSSRAATCRQGGDPGMPSSPRLQARRRSGLAVAPPCCTTRCLPVNLQSPVTPPPPLRSPVTPSPPLRSPVMPPPPLWSSVAPPPPLWSLVAPPSPSRSRHPQPRPPPPKLSVIT